jgi:hypothetical protein
MARTSIAEAGPGAVGPCNAAVALSGAASTKTTVLLTADEVDKGRENLAAYRAPGA